MKKGTYFVLPKNIKTILFSIFLIIILPCAFPACSLITWSLDDLIGVSINNTSPHLLYYIDRTTVFYPKVYLEPGSITRCSVPEYSPLDLYLEASGELYRSLMIGGQAGATYVVN